MGGWSRLFEFKQRRMARKVFAQKKHDSDLEAPRSSLEFQSDASQGSYLVRHVPCIYQLEDDWSKRNGYLIEASMKKLISDEVLAQSSRRQNTPGIVARLMGMDELPVDTKTIAHQVQQKTDRLQFNPTKREKASKVSSAHFPCNSNHMHNYCMDLESVYAKGEEDTDKWTRIDKSGKPKRREHPQEEELQKFKKEFEAWQAARFRECSKVVEELEGISGLSLSLEKSCIEKPSNDADFGRKKTSNSKECSHERSISRYNMLNSGFFRHEHEEFSSSRSRSISKDFERCLPADYGQTREAASAKIVVLKPGPDRICDHEESWTRSSGTVEDTGSMEDFLEEVKERLKLELQGKTIKRSMNYIRGSGIETPFSEKPSDPKQIAKNIAKQVRDKASRDYGMRLLRSESTRSYRSEMHFNEPDSPEFISRDKRRLLSQRLRNVLKHKTSMDVPATVNSSSRPSMVDNGSHRVNEIMNFGYKQGYFEIENDDEEIQTRCFSHRDDNRALNGEMSPRNLVRSLSAPVSGTSFGKLLLEDRHILTGAQIRRKHEYVENMSTDVRKRKKEKFNFREKVSNMRYSFLLRRRLFGKKIQSMLDLPSFGNGLANDVTNGPTVVMNFSERHDNSTEVPPSPASVCSGTQEEYFNWRQVDHNSEVSTPDTNLEKDGAYQQVFKEISSNLIELRRQLNELDSGETTDLNDELQPIEPPAPEEEMELENDMEAYVRDLLIASGLYDGSAQKSLSPWDSCRKPVSIEIFNKVEESYKNLCKEHDSVTNDPSKVVDHKMLLDLLNEALSTLLRPPVTSSKPYIASRLSPPLLGRKLLDSVWEITRAYLYPPADRSFYGLERMVAGDLRSFSWLRLMNDEIDIIGKELACQIVGDLVGEVVQDMH